MKYKIYSFKSFFSHQIVLFYYENLANCNQNFIFQHAKTKLVLTTYGDKSLTLINQCVCFGI